MHDYHMHYPADFNPKAPRKPGDDGMVCAPGLRAECELCQVQAKPKPAKAASA
jgi:hypothetical protein